MDLCQHVDLSSIQTPKETLGNGTVVTPTLGRKRLEDPWGTLASQEKLMSLKSKEETLLQKWRWAVGAHTFNPNMWEAEVGRYLVSSKPA